jgi:hypothetical protein
MIIILKTISGGRTRLLEWSWKLTGAVLRHEKGVPPDEVHLTAMGAFTGDLSYERELAEKVGQVVGIAGIVTLLIVAIIKHHRRRPAVRRVTKQ